MATSEQLRAQRAYGKVSEYVNNSKPDDRKKYKSFATGFPALIHQCGLAQAIAYAQNKAPVEYRNDLAAVLDTSMDEFAQQARTAPLPAYQRHTRMALSAASWLKRYAEALLRTEQEKEVSDGQPSVS